MSEVLNAVELTKKEVKYIARYKQQWETDFIDMSYNDWSLKWFHHFPNEHEIQKHKVIAQRKYNIIMGKEEKQPWRSRFHKWFNLKIDEAQWIHKTKQSRIRFGRFYKLSLFLNLFAFMLSVAFLWLFGLRYDPQEPNPYSGGTHYAFLVIAIFIFIVACLYGILVNALYLPILFKESKALYQQTFEYHQIVNNFTEIHLATISKKELKWLLKLSWINKTQYSIAMTEKLVQEKKEKEKAKNEKK